MNFNAFQYPLKSYLSSQLVFVGLGNPLRGDDGSGLLFLRLLARSGEYPNACFIEAGTNPENYLQKILDFKGKAIIFIDAADFGGVPGEIRWLDRESLSTLQISTHAYSITLVETYIRNFYPYAFFYAGIQPEFTQFGEGLSDTLAQSVHSFFNEELTRLPNSELRPVSS